MAKKIANKTTYFGAIDKMFLGETRLRVLNGFPILEDNILLKNSFIFKSKTLKSINDLIIKHAKTNFVKNKNLDGADSPYQFSNKYVIVKCKDINKTHTQIIKIYDNKNIKNKVDICLLLV